MSLTRLREPWTDRKATVLLGTVASAVLVIIVLMIVFVLAKAWPSLHANGLAVLGGGRDVDADMGKMIATGQHPPAEAYTLRAWPLIYATILTSFFAVVIGLAISLLAAIFIVEFAPKRLAGKIVPAVRLLAAVPSVVYGLIGILVLVPFINNHLISTGRKESVQYVVQLDGTGVLVSIIILTIMITPIMISLIVDALRAIPASWREGAAALGANRWEAIWGVSVRAAKPAIIAAAVLATARALGEAIMLSMVSGSVGFAPNPFDGPLFWLEPLRPLASTIVDHVLEHRLYSGPVSLRLMLDTASSVDA